MHTLRGMHTCIVETVMRHRIVEPKRIRRYMDRVHGLGHNRGLESSIRPLLLLVTLLAYFAVEFTDSGVYRISLLKKRSIYRMSIREDRYASVNVCATL